MFRLTALATALESCPISLTSDGAVSETAPGRSAKLRLMKSPLREETNCL